MSLWEYCKPARFNLVDLGSLKGTWLWVKDCRLYEGMEIKYKRGWCIDAWVNIKDKERKHSKKYVLSKLDQIKISNTVI